MSLFKLMSAMTTCAVIAVAMAGCSRTESSGPAVADTIPWRTDYSAALDEAKKADKPILIDFSATWCPTCQEMKRSSWPDQRVNHLATTAYIPLNLDVDAASSKAATQRYAIDTLPAILVVDSDGKVLRQTSYMNAEELTKFLSAK